jgi:hypothetical protein
VIRTTVPSPRFDTYAVFESGPITTFAGVVPVASFAIRELSLVWNTESVPSSGLTIATCAPSLASAIVLDRDARARIGTAPAGASCGA